METKKKISLDYLRRLSDDYNLTLEQASKILPEYEVTEYKKEND